MDDSSSGATGAPRARVLLVDDCDDTRELYAEFLSRRFDVFHAGSGAEAVSKASELRPSAIVMDLMLPDMGGKDAISILRRAEHTRNIPVVVVSGFSESVSDAPRAWDAHLLKPCPPDTLEACITDLIRQRTQPQRPT